MADRLFIPVTRELLPQIKERYPFIYIERGRIEIDDSSVKWIDCNGNVVRLPIATILTLLLGPGTSITHEAIKVLSDSNCTVCWTGEDSLLFYALGKSPTSDTRNLRLQASLSCDDEKALVVAKRMFSYRFPDTDVSEKTLPELMGMEGLRVRQLYEDMAEKYKVGWTGRSYTPGKFELSDLTNKILTASNTALYSLLLSSIHALGYSPYLGFIHSGSPLPFIYDLADLYKEHLTIDLAFSMTAKLAGQYKKNIVAGEFKERVIECRLLETISDDISFILTGKHHGSRSRK